jgi:hypothetical protein
MKLPAAAKTTVLATAISVSALDPRAAPMALGLAVAKEGFDLLHARMHKTAVLSYMRARGLQGHHKLMGSRLTLPYRRFTQDPPMRGMTYLE